MLIIVPDPQDKEKAEIRSQVFDLQHEHEKRCYHCSTSKTIREKRDKCETYYAYCTLRLNLPK